MRNINLLIALTTSTLLISACAGEEKVNEVKESSSAVSGEAYEDAAEMKGEFVTIAEKTLKEIYNIDNFKIDMSSSKLNVFHSPDDKNSETGEEYTNIITGMTEYTYQDKIYNLILIYSKTSEESYKILSMSTNYNHDLGIDVPLESDSQ